MHIKQIWKQFDKERASTAQMASLVIPVCGQQLCLKETTKIHIMSVDKLVQDSGHQIDPTMMFSTTAF